jgi:hypothetical protein
MLAFFAFFIYEMIIKKGRKIARVIIITFSFIILVSFAVAFLLTRQVTPPVDEMETARELIFEAWNSGADQNSFDLIKVSESYYDSAMTCWQNENKKIFFARDYSRIRKYAIQSAELADKARDRTVAQNSGQKIELREKLDNLKREIDDFNSVYHRIPLPQSVRMEYNKVNLFYSEAEQQFADGQNILCEKKIVDAGIAIYNTYRKTVDYLKNYLKKYPEWQQWAWSTIDSSILNQSSVIIVDKFSRNLFVYQNGILMNTFQIELGANWIGDKRWEGDKATPEGFYRVTEKLDSRKTRFYKALLLNYPNEYDLQNFDTDRQNGTVHASARIGGAIEIHGQGGVGTDWTNGCIALKDPDMDIVFGYSSPGTMVTIVGSLRSLNEVMKERVN